jgi:AI-2 transport protein TqsA
VRHRSERYLPQPRVRKPCVIFATFGAKQHASARDPLIVRVPALGTELAHADRVKLPAALGKGTKTLLVLALAVVIGAGLKASASLIVPLLVAAFIAAATQPLVDYLESRGFPTFLAVLATMIGAAACIVGFGALLAVAISDFSDSVPAYRRSIAHGKLQAAAWLTDHGLSRGAASVASFDVAEAAERLLGKAALAMPDAVSAAGIVLFVLIFVLLEVASFRRKMHRGLHWLPQQFEHVRHAVEDVKKYLFVKTALSAATGVLCGLLCMAFGVEAALLWGLLAFVLNFIPNIGSIIAVGPPLAIALVEYGPGRALAILGGYLIVNNVIGNLLEPKIMGRALGLSALVVVLSVIIWGWLLGPIGALLSVPLTMTLKLLCANTEDLRWVAVLLGSGDGRGEVAYIAKRDLERKSTGLTPPPGANAHGSAA